MSRPFDFESSLPESCSDDALVYSVSYRTAWGWETARCTAAADALLIASQRLGGGVAEWRATCDGVLLTLSELAEMASSEKLGPVEPDLVWSG